MAQQQARRDDDQFKNLDRTDDQEIQDGDVGKNSDQVFGTTGGTATDPVAVYAYESSTVGGVPAAGAGGMPAADHYRYEYTAVYETTTVPTAAPGFDVGAGGGGGGGGGFGQQANADQGAGGGDKTGGSRNRNMNMNMDRDQK